MWRIFGHKIQAQKRENITPFLQCFKVKRNGSLVTTFNDVISLLVTVNKNHEKLVFGHACVALRYV
jgi:hypothetical protein